MSLLPPEPSSALVTIRRRLYEYIWLDAEGNVRSKTRVVGEEAPAAHWDFDGSSTGQATSAASSEIGLHPVSIWRDPLRAELVSNTPSLTSSHLVLCDLLDSSNNPVSSSWRFKAERVFRRLPEHTVPWFGFEQEYYMMDGVTGLPLGFTGEAQGPFYCGTNRGRALAEEHMSACLAAGLSVSGINSEVGPAQWEYQIGPVVGLNGADQLIISRYLLVRLAEKHGIRISFHPKPLAGYNGSGCHTNFSTALTRMHDGARSGTLEIERIIRRLSVSHTDVMTSGAYGADNHLRLTGTHEASAMERFTWGVADRTASVRIGRVTWWVGSGYFEDRRPAANMNPYRVVSVLAEAAMSEATGPSE